MSLLLISIFAINSIVIDQAISDKTCPFHIQIGVDIKEASFAFVSLCFIEPPNHVLMFYLHQIFLAEYFNTISNLLKDLVTEKRGQ